MSGQRNTHIVANLRWVEGNLQIDNGREWVWAQNEPDLFDLAVKEGKLVRKGDKWKIVSPAEWRRRNGRSKNNNSGYLTNGTGNLTGSSVDPQQKTVHWLVPCGLAMLATLIGLMLFSTVAGWVQSVQDDWHYGRPRTIQVDAVVGHSDGVKNPSHFIAVNLHGQAVVIELQGGDASKTVIYSGPYIKGSDADLAVVKLDFRDVTNDNLPDMILDIKGSKYVFVNDPKEGKFRQLKPGESTSPL